jgi:hypothetical protein
MIEIKCPRCGSYDFDCYDIAFGANYELTYAKCYCDDCDCQFDIRYEAVDIELEEDWIEAI